MDKISNYQLKNMVADIFYLVMIVGDHDKGASFLEINHELFDFFS